MTFFRIEVKTLSKAAGQACSATFGYDNREKHKDKSDLSVVGSINMPTWSEGDTGKFWAAADHHERANASLARRIILSFPHQLATADREAVVRKWLLMNCPNMPASWAIHDNPDADPRNPHAHLLISERQVDGIARPPELFFKRFNSNNPDKGGCKKGDISSNRKQWLANARESWAVVLNQHLPSNAQVDHRSLEDQGIQRSPQPKFGAKVLSAERRGIRTRLVSTVVENEINKCKIRCLSFVDVNTGKTVTYQSGIDRGDSVEIVGKVSKSKVIDLVNACREKGWREVELFGSDEFKAMAIAELKRAGIRIKGENDEQQNSGSPRNADEGSYTEDSGEGREGSNDRTSPNRTEHVKDCRSSREQTGGDGTTDSHHRFTTPEAKAEAFTDAPTANFTDASDDSHVMPHLASMRLDIADLAKSFGLQGQRAGVADMQKDMTSIMAKKQLQAMKGCKLFELGIRDSRTGKMQNFWGNTGEILASISNLKRKNAQGCDIYIRPDPSQPHPFVMLDDLRVGTINEMKANGIEPIIEIETSPMNYQVLIKLPKDMDKPARKVVERIFQQKFGSDLGACDGMHYFRLAGFTNRKANRVQENGMFPFVKVSVSSRSDSVLSNKVWQPLKMEMETRMADELLPLAKPLSLLGGSSAPSGGVMVSNVAVVKMFTQQFARMRKQYPDGFDQSRADFAVARNAFQRGYSRDQISVCLTESSPRLAERHASLDYLQRTLDKAYAAATAATAATDRVNLDQEQERRKELENRRRIPVEPESKPKHQYKYPIPKM